MIFNNLGVWISHISLQRHAKRVSVSYQPLSSMLSGRKTYLSMDKFGPVQCSYGFSDLGSNDETFPRL